MSFELKKTYILQAIFENTSRWQHLDIFVSRRPLTGIISWLYDPSISSQAFIVYKINIFSLAVERF